ncbi:helix-turn-helix domain-containing protein [Enterococcus sp. DIV0187]|uniref:helix-turn-helix domain-containing protein n=1 Tax=Enterococcus sp. DIV0187 TaxID=2774644 RepID=UPI003F28A159
MNQVLILTRNILAEKEIQHKLQTLNYEVYCSSRIFEKCNQQIESLDFLNFFQYVVLSETICESEIMQLVPRFKEYSIRIIRKVEKKVTEIDHHYLEKKLINAIISNDDSIDELRECFHMLKQQNHPEETFENKRFVQLSDKVSLIRPNSMQEEVLPIQNNYQLMEALHNLSQTETKILTILIQAEGGIVTREKICHQIWEEEVNRSHLASLSSTITRIKSKFEHADMTNKAIHTLWGKGYRINLELLDQIKKSASFNKLVLNG